MSVRSWSTVGLVAQVVFVVGWLLAQLWQGAHYDPVAHSISDMYADGAPHAWFLIVLLTVCGLATTAFALLGLRPALRGSGRTGTVGSVLLALSVLGLGDLLSPFEREACRLADPGCTPAGQLASTGGVLDGILTSAGLALLVTAGFLLAVALGRRPGQRRAARQVRLGTVVVLVLLLATFLVPGAGGLLERLLAAAGAVLVALVALAVRRQDHVPAG